MTTPIPEIERAAITILAHARADHPVLRNWVKLITRDPNFTGHLCRVPDASYAWMYEADDDGAPGYPQVTSDDTLYGMLLDHTAHRPVPSDATSHQRTIAKLRRQHDEDVARLAAAVVGYRCDGRPTGDQQHDLQGLGGTLAVVTTSLAAAVADYAHSARASAYDIAEGGN